MPIAIKNMSATLVLLRFNSGITRYLAPGEAVTDVEEVDVKGNERLRRLAERRLIALHAETAEDRAAEKKQKEKRNAKERESPNSRSMTAAEAIEHIENTPLADLGGFVPADEDRATVLRAWEEKRAAQ